MTDEYRKNGLGADGTIPSEPGSVGVGAGEATTFEPEEDPRAARNRDPESPNGGDTAAADSATDTED
jgi:hypothetical protein